MEAQWIRICLPMQGTWVQSLVKEDPICCRAAEPVDQNHGPHTLGPSGRVCSACVPRLLKPQCLELMLHNKRSHYSGKPAHHSEE